MGDICFCGKAGRETTAIGIGLTGTLLHILDNGEGVAADLERIIKLFAINM